MIKERGRFQSFGWVSKLFVGYKGGAIEDIEVNTETEVQEQEEVVEENDEVSDIVSEED